MEMFADNTKIWKKIWNLECSLKEDLDRLTEWSRKWLLLFNPEKCKVMHIAHDVKTVYRLAVILGMWILNYVCSFSAFIWLS